MNERSDHSAMQCLWGLVPWRTLPWGTPQVTTDSVDTSPAKLIVCERFMMNDWIQSMTDPRIANADCKQSSRIWWSTVSKAVDRSSNANQLRFMVVGKRPSNFVADPLIMCLGLLKVGYGILNFAAAARMDIGHFVSFSHCFHCSLHCLFTPTRSFCVSFVLVNHLPVHSLQKSMPMRHFMCKRHFFVAILIHLKYILPQLPYQNSQENTAAGRHPPWTFDYHMEKSELFCDV